MSIKKQKTANGAGSRFAESVPLSELGNCSVEVGALSPLHETYMTRSSFINFGLNHQTVRSFEGGEAVVLKVQYEETAGTPRWSLLLKICEEDDAAFYTACKNLNSLLKGVVRNTTSLSYAEPSIPFTAANEENCFLFNCRVTVDAGKSPSLLSNKAGKVIAKGFEVLRAGQRIKLSKLSISSVYISTFKKDEAEISRARLSIQLKKAQLVSDLQDAGAGGKKRKSISMSVSDLIEAGSE